MTSMDGHLRTTATSMLQPVYLQPKLMFYYIFTLSTTVASLQQSFLFFPFVTSVGRLHYISTMSRFIVVDYNRGKSDDPRIASDFVRLDSAKNEFEELKDAIKARSVVLFDTESAEVKQIAMLGEPIFLAKALTFARTFVKDKSLLEKGVETAAKGIASSVISEIAKKISGEAYPGVGGVVLGHFIAPYYAFQGDGVAVIKAATGMYGGLSGAVIGQSLTGPFGAFIGGVAGSFGVGNIVTFLVKLVSEHPKCTRCNGTGLIGYYEVCPVCQGYGYKH